MILSFRLSFNASWRNECILYLPIKHAHKGIDLLFSLLQVLGVDICLRKAARPTHGIDNI